MGERGENERVWLPLSPPKFPLGFRLSLPFVISQARSSTQWQVHIQWACTPVFFYQPSNYQRPSLQVRRKCVLRGYLHWGMEIVDGGQQLYVGFKVEKGREGIKNGWRQKQKCNLGPSAFFTALITTFQKNYHNNQLMVTPNEMVGLHCHDRPLNDLPPIFNGLSLVLGSF